MKKTLLLAAVAVCIISVIACGTLAYFTDSMTKTNKFMTASYNPEKPTDPDDIFSIVVNEDGKVTADELKADPTLVPGTENQSKTGLDYKNILPGSKAVKKVNVKNTGDYSAYVRVKITVSHASKWIKILGEDNKANNLVSKLATDLNTAKWTYVDDPKVDKVADTVTYTYTYNTALAKDATTENIFTKIVVPTTLTKEQFVTIDGFTVAILGEAIQSDYTGTVSEAFAKYDAQNK